MDGGRAGEDRRREGGGMAGGVPAVFLAAAVVLVVCRWCWWWWLVRYKSKYKCTPISWWCAVVVYDLFCTTDNLHHAGRAGGGGEVVTLAGGLAELYPPIDSDGWDDIGV